MKPRGTVARLARVSLGLGVGCLGLIGPSAIWRPVPIGALRASGQSARTAGADQARERAYRANNVGVARLEQFDYEAAVRSFRDALQIDPELTIARVNLGLGLFYANRLDEAATEARRALEGVPDSLQAHYLLGLIAKSQNRTDEAVVEFERVLKTDPADVGSRVNLGQVYLQQRRFKEALDLFRAALDVEPFNVTAAYNLAIALTRSGDRDAGQQAMSRFQALRDSAYGTTYSQIYLEQGRYAEAVASTGAEPELIDETEPAVTFSPVDETGWLDGSAAPQPTVAATLLDADGDGDLDLATIAPQSVTMYRNVEGRFTLFPKSIELTATGSTGSLAGAVAGDYDNDGRPDLFLLRLAGNVLLHQEADGTFRNVSEGAGIPQKRVGSRSAAFVDVDHDGDLDIVVGGFVDESSGGGGADYAARSELPPDLMRLPAASNQLLRNNGNGTFVDIATEAGVATSGRVLGMAPTDFDNRRDIDLVIAPFEGAPVLFRNLRDGTFADAGATTGLPERAPYTCLTVADVNKDGFPDVFFGRADQSGIFSASNGRGRFDSVDAPASSRGAVAAAFVDYDNDGLLDLLTLTRTGPRLFRNLGSRWVDVSSRAFPAVLDERRWATARTMALGDLDQDGDSDTIIVVGGRLELWRNEGGNHQHSLTVRLAPTVSNRGAAGAKIEMRAGSLRQRLEVASVTPAVQPADLVFGLGRRESADVVRVLWPAGILQAETDLPSLSSAPPDRRGGSRAAMTVTELNRKPSSCPYLYTWNGNRFEFLTDFMGGGEMGAWIGPNLRNASDPDEYVRIRGDQLRERNGRLELRVTNELEEALFVDRLELVSIDHLADTNVYPNEGLLPPPRPPFRLFTIAGARPLLKARDDCGHDVLDELRAVDRRYADDFELERIRGYAKPHALVLDPGELPATGAVMLLTGWTDYAFSGDNVAAHQAGLTMAPPVIQVRESAGRWRDAGRFGFPVGRPQTLVVELKKRPPGVSSELRIVTNMRIYWDQIVIGQREERHPSVTTHLDASSAALRWRGFSEAYAPDGREPLLFAYDRVSAASPWKIMPGRYTREGDVRELLAQTDDRFVVARPGDEIALSFDATSLRPLQPGWTRTFLLFSDGFSKEMDLNSSSPDQVAPLPHHGMATYPDLRLDTDFLRTRQAYLDRYNTRVVTRMIPPLETSGEVEEP